VAIFGVPVLMILAAMAVTGEYRSGMIRTTFMATPNRALVLVAKAVVAAVYAAAIVVVNRRDA
jgi:ABC-2 type transport system permease protein